MAVDIEVVPIAVGERTAGVTAALPVVITGAAIMPIAREIGVGGGAGLPAETETGSRYRRAYRECHDSRRALAFLGKGVRIGRGSVFELRFRGRCTRQWREK